MTFWRTLGLTLILTVLFGFLFLTPFVGSIVITFIVFILIGLALFYLFRKQSFEEIMAKITFIYMPASIVAICTGFITTAFEKVMEMRAIQAAATKGVEAAPMASFFAQQIIPLELLLLLIGIFGPLYMFKWKEAEYRQLIWNTICVLIVYGIGLLIYTLKIKPLFELALT